MTTCWTTPRKELIARGVALARKGYNIMSIADNMTIRYFSGRNHKSAKKHLAGAIARQFWIDHCGRTERQEEIADMAGALRAEGWSPLFDNNNNNERCFWIHTNTRLSVNCNGGYFHNYATATRAAYESPLRAILKEGD